ncbi:hypothetical protein Tsubulata_028392 [Turnera subulata]|uniref:EamA domain-containing protein n=1 Tax=Turnera subulata TaxID=218843 RepID=A0A9Q0JF02_9ROSI|nr:hypothetical protein Tsubulata_028392 [Turnera subulata]
MISLGCNRVQPGGHKHTIQGGYFQRDELLCLRLLFLRRFHSCSHHPSPLHSSQKQSSDSFIKVPSFLQNPTPWAYWIRALGDTLGFKGIDYCSPTLDSAISNLLPAFTFALAVIFSSSAQAKIIGSIVSVSGAMVLTLYKGPIVLSIQSGTQFISLQQISGSSQSLWMVGSLLITTEYLLCSVWYIIQTQVMKIYPAELVVVFFYYLCGTIILAPGLFGYSLTTFVQTWALRLKGPVYVATFKPLSIAIAAIMGFIFLGDALYLGSIIGAVIISIGFYTVLWGKAQEQETIEGGTLRNREMASKWCYRDAFPFTALVTMECINIKNTSTTELIYPLQNWSSRPHRKLISDHGIHRHQLQLAYSCFSHQQPHTSVYFHSCHHIPAKVIGTLVSITGAFIVTLYKGPPIAISSSPSLPSHHQSLHSPNQNWVLGGIFLTAEYILVPLWYIVQTQIMKEYPAELTVVFFYNLCVSIIAAIVALITEGTSSAWIVRPNIALASIFCSGLFGSCINNTVHTWALRLKGPVFVAMFKPLSIAIAVAMGVMFLGDALYLGSLIGATIISVGFYTVMWGKYKEEVKEDLGVGSRESSSSSSSSSESQKVPLLQSYKNEIV